jgi:hypothetical protein
MQRKQNLLRQLIREEVRRSLTEAPNQRVIDALETAIEDMLADTEMGIDELEAGQITIDEFRKEWNETTDWFTGQVKTIIRNIGR